MNSIKNKYGMFVDSKQGKFVKHHGAAPLLKPYEVKVTRSSTLMLLESALALEHT